MTDLLARLRESGDPRADYLAKLVELANFRTAVCVRDTLDPSTDVLVRAVNYAVGLLIDDMLTQPEYRNER